MSRRRRRCFELLRTLLEERQMALMLISTRSGVVAQTADYVLVMYLGTIVEQGPVEEVFPRSTTSVHACAAAFMPSVLENHARARDVAWLRTHSLNRPSVAHFIRGCPRRSRPLSVGGAQRRLVGAAHAMICHLEVDPDGRKIEHCAIESRSSLRMCC